MKAVKAKLAETNPDRVEAFEKGAQGYAKKIVANFKDFEFVRSFCLLASSLFISPPLPPPTTVYWGKYEP